MKLGKPRRIGIEPIKGKKRFRFLLLFEERPEPIEFETS